MHPRVPSVAASLGFGVLATGPALFILVVFRAVLGSPGLLEVVADGALHYVPLPVFDASIAAFGAGAKGGLSLGVALGVIVAGAVAAPFLLRWTTGLGTVGAGLVAAGVALLVVELAILPLNGAGLFGSETQTDPVALQLPVVVACIAYGLTLTLLARTAAPAPAASPAAPRTDGAAAAEAPGDPSRRLLLRRGLLAFGGISLLASVGAIGWRAASAAHVTASTVTPTAPPTDPFGPTPALTPVGDFYTVAKDLGAPSVGADGWRLKVGGLVDSPFAMTLDEIRALPAAEAYRTLMCISDDIVAGDRYIGNQRWRGFPVSDLLDRAGVQPAAKFVLWEAEDGYTESLPVDVAHDPDTWLVHEMDGRPLTADHGFPVRVLIADRFGMKGPKWLRSITLSETDHAGYWERNGWDGQAHERILSRIDLPKLGDTVAVGAPFPVTGVAFAGARGVSRVEVSADGGYAWVDAHLEDATVAPLGPLTWVRYRAVVTVPRAGGTTLVVRATDGTGAVQAEHIDPPAPSGSSGWQQVQVVAA